MLLCFNVKEKVMKSVNELRIPAYAVVDVCDGKCVELLTNREQARHFLQEYKSSYPEYKFKILKLQAEKWVR